MFVVQNYPFSSFNTTYTTENVTQFGVGIGFGGKWDVKNIVLEASVGFGKTFNNDQYYEPVFGKGMLGIRYRF